MVADPRQFDLAAYSSNPGFTAGLDIPHPISAANKSMFNQPGVAEALEAVYIEGHPEAADSSEESVKAAYPEGFDFELAMKGLRRLRDDLSDATNPNLRPAVLATKSLMPSRERAQVEEEWAKQRQAEIEAEQQAEIKAAEAARQDKEAARLNDHQRQLEYRSNLATVANRLRIVVPDIDTEPFLELCEELTIHEDSDGLRADPTKSFHAKLSNRTSQYLQDPKELVNDFAVMLGLESSAVRASDHTNGEAITAYKDAVYFMMTKLVAESSYAPKDFSPEVLDKWTGLAASLPDDMSPTELGKACQEGQLGAVSLTSTMERGQKVLSKSLQEIAKQHPIKFLEKLHMTAEGLDPKHKLKTHFISTIIEGCLSAEPLAKGALAISAGTIGDSSFRQKAIDLQVTLDHLGFPPSVTGIASEGDGIRGPWIMEFTPKQGRVLDRLPPSILLRRNKVHVSRAEEAAINEQHGATVDAFLEYAAKTAEGRSSTLIGRFIS
jgi:hypothetical protein